MPPRKLQQIIASDPSYARTLDGRSDPQPLARPSGIEARPGRQAAPEAPAEAPAPVEAAPAEAPAAPVPPPTPASVRPAVGERLKAGRGAKPGQARTERIAVSVRPLLGQMERIAATGLPPQDVLKAAWRKASAGFALAPKHVEPPREERTDGPEGCYATTFTVDAEALAALSRAQDPLGVRSPWSLVRGQVEPRFWKALDELLAGLDHEGRKSSASSS